MRKLNSMNFMHLHKPEQGIAVRPWLCTGTLSYDYNSEIQGGTWAFR